MNDVKVGSWSVEGSPVTIEYSLVVIEEIRHEVANGYQRLSRGGIEVGGVLYGTREGSTVRIMAMRPIACEHARGPGFALSDKDRVELHDQLVGDAQDPRLEGMISVGWFLSHTRTDITLTDADLETYSIFFPDSWQVALVVRPGRGGVMRAGFFVREPDGTVRSESSYLEFNFPDRLAGVLDRSLDRPARDRTADRRPQFYPPAEASMLPPAVPREAIPSAPPASAPVDPPYQVPAFEPPPFRPTPPPRRRWIWLLPWAIAVLSLAYLAFRSWIPRTSPPPEPISLAILEREGQLLIEWNHDAAPIESARDGSLEIIDGPEKQTVALSRQVLATGRFTYLRSSGEVEVRMTVHDASGVKVQEASRFVGRLSSAGPKSEELTEMQRQRDELALEVRRLRDANSGQAARIQQLERTLRILQTRLGIDQSR